ncbi:hypothetical protein M9435_005091 [Picochlorum sp. BPE23]|nr:hypothetical protein M9435_005091 [Picochlorum sp. BPE23]
MWRTRLGVVGNHVRGDRNDDVCYSPEVRQAPSKALVVALESTIVSHGMPWPQNYSTAKEVEDIIRRAGAVPATICILKGKIHVGLTDDELRYIAQDATRMKKLSRRDVAHAMAMGLDGATTVASTMLLAHLVGIRVFVTGGIGGVHRSFLDTMDVSADLTELGRTPVTVVCAGAKSILDIPKTMEYLETQGVCVAAYKTDEFPAFYTAKSHVKAPCRFDSAADVARTMVCSLDALGASSGMVVGVPPPPLTRASHRFEEAIERALREAQEKAITGAKETPFVLRRVAELTQGESLLVNMMLVKNNAQVGAEIARELFSMCNSKIG